MPKLLSKSLGSADLTRPTASVNWVLGATAAGVALFLALSFAQPIAGWLGSGVRSVAGITPSQGFSFAA